jgi:hypothetical protein
MSAPPPSTAPRFFQPATLVAGVVLGLIVLAWAGRVLTGRDWHRDFFRFHPMIAPESMYQPTIGEMRAIVRARCRADQILVIVGGNSILQGVGQPVEKLWTRHLQELLGDRFCVVNLAFRGSSPTDGGSLVAESLRDEFPRQIYLANVPPFSAANPAGHLDYRFLLLDAYYKGWLLDFPARQTVIDDYLAHPKEYPAARELALGARLDAWLRFRDFWNWWSFTRFFTFPTSMAPTFKLAYQPRNKFPDREPDYELTPALDRFLNQYVDLETQITRNTSSPYYEKDAAGNWQPIGHAMKRFDEFASVAFPEKLKARTLIIVAANCPFYIRRLTPDERMRDEMAIRDTVTRWKTLGYGALDYGPGFVDADFGDRTHLTSSGGRKLAARAAPQIQQLAEKLGYLQNQSRP